MVGFALEAPALPASALTGSSENTSRAEVAISSASRGSPGEDWCQELMQPRKWEVGLCLHARGGQDHHAVLPGPPARRRQQRRLPDTSLTGNHQRATALADAVDQIIEQPELTLATDQGKQVHLAAMIIRPRRPDQVGPCVGEHLASATLRGR